MKVHHARTKRASAFAEILSSFNNPQSCFRPLQMIHDFSFFERGGLPPNKLVALLLDRGCGGAVTNVAWGGDYLSNEKEWNALKAGVRLLQERGLAVWLYDEKGYPSGTAGEQTLQGHPEWEAMGVFCAAQKVHAGEHAEVTLPSHARDWVHCVALPLVGATVDPTEALEVPFREAESVRWRAPNGKWVLLCFATRTLWKSTFPASEFGWVERAYVNLLTPEATETFCRMTHCSYAEHLRDCWEGVDAIFTDEPALASAYFDGTNEEGRAEVDSSVQDFLDSPHRTMEPGECPPSVPWEARFPVWFEQMKGYSVRTVLPALFLDFPGARQLRCDFYDVVSQKVADSYMGVIRKHCEDLDILSSGHVFAEDWLHQHALFEGDLYGNLRRFHIPGVDMLVGKPETIMASQLLMIPKMASSVSHAIGAPSAMIEHFDYCERHGWIEPWPLSMEERIATLALLFALGVETIVSYMPFHELGSPIDARLKPRVPRDNEPLGPEYRDWTDCAGRLAQLLRGGSHVCDIAVYYPIEGIHAILLPSAAGQPDPREANPAIRSVEDTYVNTCRTLLSVQRDFDFIDDEVFVDARFEDGSLKIADESYRALILTHTPVIPLKVLRGILRFVQAGGLFILVGAAPEGVAQRGAEEEFRRTWQVISEGNFLHAGGCDAIPSLLADRLEPDILLEPAAPQVVALHKRHPDRDTYLLVNTGGDAVTFKARFAAKGRTRLLCPITGAVATLKPLDGAFLLSLDGYRSAAVVFSRSEEQGDCLS